jgi:hypothetical protein
MVHFVAEADQAPSKGGRGGSTLCGERFVPHTYFGSDPCGTSTDKRMVARYGKRSCAACLSAKARAIETKSAIAARRGMR